MESYCEMEIREDEEKTRDGKLDLVQMAHQIQICLNLKFSMIK